MGHLCRRLVFARHGGQVTGFISALFLILLLNTPTGLGVGIQGGLGCCRGSQCWIGNSCDRVLVRSVLCKLGKHQRVNRAHTARSAISNSSNDEKFARLSRFRFSIISLPSQKDNMIRGQANERRHTQRTCTLHMRPSVDNFDYTVVPGPSAVLDNATC